MAQDVKLKVSLDDQLTKELEILLKNLADPVGKILGMLGTVAETAKTVSGGIVKGFVEVSDAVHKSGEERKKQTEAIVNETTTAGEKTAKEEKKQNEERAKSFNELYTVSLSSMWGAFTETLKNKFFSAMADIALAYVTSAENVRDSLTRSPWFMLRLVLAT